MRLVRFIFVTNAIAVCIRLFAEQPSKHVLPGCNSSTHLSAEREPHARAIPEDPGAILLFRTAYECAFDTKAPVAIDHLHNLVRTAAAHPVKDELIRIGVARETVCRTPLHPRQAHSKAQA